jgi:hypothetical protein
MTTKEVDPPSLILINFNIPALWEPDGTQIICKETVRTSQETHYIFATKPNRLMLFMETVAVYCENHTEHTKIINDQNTHVKAGATYSYQQVTVAEGSKA